MLHVSLQVHHARRFFSKADVFSSYCMLRYTRGLEHKPKRLPMSFWGWILPVYRTEEDEMIRVAGFDAATYMRIITFGGSHE